MQFQSCVWREMLLVMLEVVSSSKFILSLQRRHLSLIQLSSFFSDPFSLSIREFDEGLLRKICEIFYEDEVVNLPSAPDVSNYLMSEVFIYKLFKLQLEMKADHYDEGLFSLL